MRRAAALAALSAALALCAPARAAGLPAPELVPAQSEIGFVSHQMGVPVAGSFGRFEAQVRFDPTAPQNGHFLIGVDVASVALPTNDAMREVVKPEWFDAPRFPRAVFESTAVSLDKAGRGEIRGRLTIKGRTHDVVVPVTIEQKGGLTFASGSVVVKRLAFSVGEGEWSDTSLVADDVEIRFRLALTGIGPLAGT